MMQTDIKAKYVNATGAMGIGSSLAAGGMRIRIKGLWLATPVTAGSVVIADGSATGNVLLKFDTGAVVADQYMLFPGEGILFQGDPYVVTLSNVTSLTVFYG